MQIKINIELKLILIMVELGRFGSRFLRGSSRQTVLLLIGPLNDKT